MYCHRPISYKDIIILTPVFEKTPMGIANCLAFGTRFRIIEPLAAGSTENHETWMTTLGL